MTINFEDAYNATDPNLSDDERKASASRIMEGVRANEVYWNSRPELEALRAQAEGHGVVVRGSDEEEGSPTVVGTQTEPAIEGTATEEGAATLAAGATPAPSAATPPAAAAGATPAPSPDNPTEAVARLRQQLSDHGITPEV